jgi:protein-S-isoprenylcysteine O-methyltransferase Ste14
MTRFLARWRVTLGFAVAAAVLWWAQPTRQSLMIGAAIAVLGEALRTWAAGHLEKSKEVTRSGPYQYTRHPLYLGSSLIGVGLMIASANVLVVGLVVAYLSATLVSAMTREEAHLREKFGDAYRAYAEKRAEPMTRAFSWPRALANREHHAMAGLLAGFGLLALKLFR